MKKVFCFDMDGTLANNQHRQHWVRNKPRNWPAFNAGIKNDAPYWDIIWLAQTFYELDHTILITTARTADLREVTETWLREVACLNYHKMYMRGEKDYRDDGLVKSEMLERIRADGYEPYIWFDDRDRVVESVRANGVRCLQVQSGNF